MAIVDGSVVCDKWIPGYKSQKEAEEPEINRVPSEDPRNSFAKKTGLKVAVKK